MEYLQERVQEPERVRVLDTTDRDSKTPCRRSNLSWVSNGGNLPISAEQVISVLGSNTIAEFATKFGTNPESLGTTIAEKLPLLIDKMTPNGQVPEGSGNLLAALLSMAK